MNSERKIGRYLVPLVILAGAFIEVAGKRNREHTYSTPAPRFQETEDNYTKHKGERAILHCSVKNLGIRKVIWRRSNESLFLTVGKEIITSDPRFEVAHIDDSSDWNLMISNLSTSDTGEYECQISSTDKALRKKVHLQVKDEFSYAEPRISISGTLHVDRGMKLTLICNASGAITPPNTIDWFKDGNKIVPDVKARLELRRKVSINSRTVTSILTKASAEMSDAGTYSCRSTDLQTVSEQLNVLNTNKSANKREPEDKASLTLDKSTSCSSTLRHSYVTCVVQLFYIYWLHLLKQFIGG